MANLESCPCGEKANVYKDTLVTGQELVTGVRERCQRCGFTKTDEGWKGICVTCGKEAEKLYGLFVPHLCLPCEQVEVKRQRAAGEVCRLCRSVYLYCCC